MMTITLNHYVKDLLCHKNADVSHLGSVILAIEYPDSFQLNSVQSIILGGYSYKVSVMESQFTVPTATLLGETKARGI